MQTHEKLALLLQKANAGDPHAQLELGKAYATGNGVGVNQLQAVRWLTEASRILIAAKTEIGKIYESQKRLAQAEEWYRKAAEDNDADAMFRLGYLIYKGRLGQRPTREGLELMETAAARGHLEAKRYIDEFVDDPSARRHTKMAELKSRAELGDVGAQFQLGNIYETGIDVPVDCISAAVWYKMAADRGHPISMYRLGMMYRKGKGLPKDVDESNNYLIKSASLGNSKAKEELKRL